MRNFRLGSTSYVYPDDILPNVRQLAPIVDDVELVLFEVDGYGANLPDAAAIAELNALAIANDLSFTVHLPLDLRFGDAASFDKARRALDATRPLNPIALVMHFDGCALAGHPSAETVARWQADAAHTLDQIIEWVGDAARVCVENVEQWAPEYFREVVARAGASRCVDIGHLWLQGRDPLPHLEEHLPRTRVVHLYGVGERDHQSLAKQPRGDIEKVIAVVIRAEFRGVLTLEVFGIDDFLSSKQVLDEVLAGWADDSL